jgi:hypothetical protein
MVERGPVKFQAGQIAYYLWDEDRANKPVLLLREATPEETIEQGYAGVQHEVYTCWHVLDLASGTEWFVIDCDLEHEV